MSSSEQTSVCFGENFASHKAEVEISVNVTKKTKQNFSKKTRKFLIYY